VAGEEESQGRGGHEISDEERQFIQQLATRFLRYGCHRLFLSPRDFDILRAWWAEGIPERVVQTGLDQAYLARLRSPRSRKRLPRNLSFALRQVGKAWNAYRELRVGARVEGVAGKTAARRFARRIAQLTRDLAAAAGQARERGHADLEAQLEQILERLTNRPESESSFDTEEWLEPAGEECERILVECLPREEIAEARARARRDLQEYAADSNFAIYVDRMMRHYLREGYPLPLFTVL